MKRKYPCYACGATDGPAAFSMDAWCSDFCHKKLAVAFQVEQKTLTTEAIYGSLNIMAVVMDNLTGDPMFDDFAEEVRVYVSNAGGPGRNEQEAFLQARGAKPNLWLARGLPTRLKDWPGLPEPQ